MEAQELPGISPNGEVPQWARRLGKEVVQAFPDFLAFWKHASDAERRAIEIEIGIVASTFIPGVGDAIGAAADFADIAQNPDSRTLTNVGFALVSLIPGVPSIGRIRKLRRTILAAAKKGKKFRRAEADKIAKAQRQQARAEADKLLQAQRQQTRAQYGWKDRYDEVEDFVADKSGWDRLTFGDRMQAIGVLGGGGAGYLTSAGQDPITRLAATAGGAVTGGLFGKAALISGLGYAAYNQYSINKMKEMGLWEDMERAIERGRSRER